MTRIICQPSEKRRGTVEHSRNISPKIAHYKTTQRLLKPRYFIHTRQGPIAKMSKYPKSELVKLFIWVGLVSLPSFSQFGLTEIGHRASKVYLISHTNKPDDLEANF